MRAYGEIPDTRNWLNDSELAESGPTVQMFVSKEWLAPEYQIELARDASLTDLRAAGHSYRYYGEDDVPKGAYSGAAHRLEITKN